MADPTSPFHGVLTLTASPQALLAAFPTAATNVRLRSLSLQADGANAGVVTVGGNAGALASGQGGIVIPLPVGGVPAAPYVFEIPLPGAFTLADVFALGTANDKLHVLGTTYV